VFEGARRSWHVLGGRASWFGGALTGAIGVVTLRNPFYSVLALVFHLISLAALFLLLRAEFVAAAQVVVYAGAVMVLYVFVVAYVGAGEELAAGSALRILGPLFALALAIELCIAVLGSALKQIATRGAPLPVGFGQPGQIGDLLADARDPNRPAVAPRTEYVYDERRPLRRQKLARGPTGQRAEQVGLPVLEPQHRTDDPSAPKDLGR